MIVLGFNEPQPELRIIHPATSRGIRTFRGIGGSLDRAASHERRDQRLIEPAPRLRLNRPGRFPLGGVTKCHEVSPPYQITLRARFGVQSAVQPGRKLQYIGSRSIADTLASGASKSR